MNKYSDCTHPDHSEHCDCLDRSVGCSRHCLCCMGELALPIEKGWKDLEIGEFTLPGDRIWDWQNQQWNPAPYPARVNNKNHQRKI